MSNPVYTIKYRWFIYSRLFMVYFFYFPARLAYKFDSWYTHFLCKLENKTKKKEVRTCEIKKTIKKVDKVDTIKEQRIFFCHGRKFYKMGSDALRKKTNNNRIYYKPHLRAYYIVDFL
jgi:hypothetical protein